MDTGLKALLIVAAIGLFCWGITALTDREPIHGVCNFIAVMVLAVVAGAALLLF